MALFPIFSRKIAFLLVQQGFQILRIAPNKYKPDWNVYYFEDTLEFQKIAQPLINNK